MPAATEILGILERISNEQVLLAILYHALVLVLLIALISGWKPSFRVFGFLLTIPILSVSVLAWLYGNPFNGTTFGSIFILLLNFSFRLSWDQTKLAIGWSLPVALVMILFGLVYPHFIQGQFYMYLIAAPTGLIPCPTLSLVVGFTLLFNGLHSKKWAITLVIVGLFYGLFGALKLKVYIDVFLVAGSIALLYQAFSLKE